MKSLLKEIENKFEEIEEANVTANLDGGEGPVKTPHAFSKSKEEDELDDDHIEVLGYKKTKESKMNSKRIKEATGEKQGTFFVLDPLSAVLINVCETIRLGI